MSDHGKGSETARAGAFRASRRRKEGRRTPRLYGRAAFAAAVEDGFTPDELGQVLAGRRIVDAFPVWGDESVATYATRTVCEMMMAYVAQDIPIQHGAN